MERRLLEERRVLLLKLRQQEKHWIEEKRAQDRKLEVAKDSYRRQLRERGWRDELRDYDYPEAKIEVFVWAPEEALDPADWKPGLQNLAWVTKNYDPVWNKSALSHDFYCMEESQETAGFPDLASIGDRRASPRREEKEKEKGGGDEGLFSRTFEAFVVNFFGKKEKKGWKPLFSLKRPELGIDEITIHNTEMASIVETMQFIKETMPGRPIYLFGDPVFMKKCATVAAGLDIIVDNPDVREFWLEQKERLAKMAVPKADAPVKPAPIDDNDNPEEPAAGAFAPKRAPLDDDEEPAAGAFSSPKPTPEAFAPGGDNPGEPGGGSSPGDDGPGEPDPEDSGSNDPRYYYDEDEDEDDDDGWNPPRPGMS